MAVLTFKSDEYKSFPAILKEYASHMHVIKGNSEKTICEYLMDLRTFFRYTKMMASGEQVYGEDFEKISISDLTVDDIRKIRSTDIIEFIIYTKMERDNGTSARMRKLSALKSFFKYAYQKKNYIDSNPTENVDAPKKGTTLPKYLTVKEAIRLLETVREDVESPTNQRDYSIIALFLNTGMRLSELVGLNLESFDSDLEFVKVLGKGNKERIIYLNSAAKDAVKGYLRIRLDPKYIRTSEHAFFLSGRQTRISAKTVQWVVYKYLDKAGLGSRGLSVHKLRHTAATLMYQSGNVDIRVLKDILGHEQLNTTQIYTHLGSGNLQDAMKNNPLSDVKIKSKLH
jgi:site-specific recombinase XerD